MEPDLDKLNQYSRVNYMKRSDKSGQSTTNTSNISVSHNLGYVPQFAVYGDVDGDGMLWYGSEKVTEATESTAGGGTQPKSVDAWVTTDNLTIKPYNFGGTRPVHWLIYLDYGA